ncbi:hypothetical protein ACOMHN_021525 [Nucella lapillus]
MFKMRSMLLLLLMMVTKDDWHVSASQPSVVIGRSSIYGSTVQVGSTPVEQYLGIPYARPPVDDLRFSKPVPNTLDLIVNATTYPSTCPTIRNYNILPENEDCLYLSVYVRQSSRQGNTSVMVWFHGGAFVFGSGSQYDGAVLAAEGNVIVVTPNYRLGLLGFLSTGDNSSMGNYGLWDQWLALKWVKDNIVQFGGDSSRVTIFGESAGAASVSYHMTSPYSKGLFHRAILQSGSRSCPWAMIHNAPAIAKLVGRALSCSDVDSTESLITCLRGKPWQALRPSLSMLGGWAPVMDGDFVRPFNQSTEPFAGAYMSGVNNREGGILLPVYRATHANASQRASHLTHVQKTIRNLFPSLAATASSEEMTLAARIVDCMYRAKGSAANSSVPDAELEAFVGDIDIVVGNKKFLDAERATGQKFLYYFDHYPDNIVNGNKGMDHAMDIEYTFGFASGLRAPFSPFYNRTVSQRDLTLGQRFRTLLTNFAHSGNPNQPTAVTEWPTWPSYTKGEQSYLSVTIPPQVASHLKGDLLTVWLTTVPAILRSQGPLGLNETRWAYCQKATSSSPRNSPGILLVFGASLWVLLAVVVV